MSTGCVITARQLPVPSDWLTTTVSVPACTVADCTVMLAQPFDLVPAKAASTNSCPKSTAGSAGAGPPDGGLKRDWSSCCHSTGVTAVVKSGCCTLLNCFHSGG